MTNTELEKYFGVNSYDEVPEYDISSPVSLIGSTSRERRSLEDESSNVLFNLTAFKKHLQLNITTNYLLLAPTFIIETRHENGTISHDQGPVNTLCTGKVTGLPDSMVAVNNENGLTGIIKLSDSQVFNIHPLPDHLTRDLHADGLHLLTRRQVDEEKQDFISHVENSHETRRRRRSADSSGGFKYLKAVWIADRYLVEKQGEDDLVKYLLIMANVVAGIFYDNSIGDIKVTYVINKIIVDRGSKHFSYEKTDNLNKLLDHLEAWIDEENEEREHPDHFDVATLVTGSGGGGGRGSIGSMCKKISGNANSDNGLSGTAHTIAHETGHNFGIAHDGGSKECPDDVYIMSSATAGGKFAKTWSTCSKTTMQRFLTSTQSTCLDIPPKARGRPFMPDRLLPGQVITADRQCEAIYGQGYVQCRVRKHICGSIFCSQINHLQACKSPTAPTLDGTKCGERKWCIHGECVDDGSEQINGGWSRWSRYKACSKTCGGGLRWKERTCNNPTPNNGGAYCEGSTRGDYQICNSQECEVHLSDRLLQCMEYDSSHRDHFVKEEPCLLKCLSTGNTVYTRGFMVDGSRCNNDPRAKDVCVQSKCTKVGCDSLLDSGKDFDRCGICNGDGTTCELINGEYTIDWKGRGVGRADTMVTLPTGSTGIEFKKSSITWNYIGIQDLGGTYLYSIPTYSTVLYYGNSQVNYTRKKSTDKDELHIDGPISEPLKIMFIRIYDKNSGISYKYYKPTTRQLVPDRYFRWTTGEWSECSETCAGGSQIREVVCTRIDDGSRVRDDVCKSTRPITLQTCNIQACSEAEWFVGHWSSCTKSCGKGSQSREVYCRRKLRGESYKKVSNNNCKASDKPDELSLVQQACNQVACPANWTPRQWSQCSSTCKGGRRTRRLVCARINKQGEEDVISEILCRNSRKTKTSEPCNVDTPCLKTVTRPTTRPTTPAKTTRPPTNPAPTPVREVPNKVPPPKGQCIETDSGECCKTPVKYKGYKYSWCTSAGSNKPWCYTQSKGWSYCKYETAKIHDLGCYKLFTEMMNKGKWAELPALGSEESRLKGFDAKCAYRAAQKGYTFFAVISKRQVCLGSRLGRSTFYTGGTARTMECDSYDNRMKVYSFENAPMFESTGCYVDDVDDRALGSMIVNFRYHLTNWNPKQFASIVERCAFVAAGKGLKMFGVQNFGECWGSPGDQDYDKHSQNVDDCKFGIGASLRNSVYQFE